MVITVETLKGKENQENAGLLSRPITRRQAIMAGGIAVVGLAFSKPLIETVMPKPAFANYVTNGGGGSCTPGYWKTHPVSLWPSGVVKGTQLGTVFNFTAAGVPGSVAALATDSFQTALEYPGGGGVVGGARILLRAGTASYLNALASSQGMFAGGVTFPLTAAQVVTQVNNALASGDRDTMIAVGGILDDKNNDGECKFLVSGPAAP
jgi:hypothetical protein